MFLASIAFNYTFTYREYILKQRVRKSGDHSGSGDEADDDATPTARGGGGGGGAPGGAMMPSLLSRGATSSAPASIYLSQTTSSAGSDAPPQLWVRTQPAHAAGGRGRGREDECQSSS